MTDMVLPGVYVTVRDEGLISVGGVSAGNLGIVGTSEKGASNQVYAFSSLTEAKVIFEQGSPLLKALELAYANGAHIVYAVRVEPPTAVTTLPTAPDPAAETRTTNTPKGWAENYATALALLENEMVNIVLLVGAEGNYNPADALKNHLTATAAIKRERIGVMGCGTLTSPDDVKNPNAIRDDGRLIYVAPGLSRKYRDPNTGQEGSELLSGAYMAAAVAGLLASLPVQTSPTNKTLNLSGLAAEYNYAQLQELVTERVLAIEKREGYRVVKGITTATNPAWSQITTRRIVDYAIYGVRAACNPYIGKLNNTRVRAALKATIDGFLTRMVESEALIGYQLEVSADRAQEIAGQAIVTLSIQPTFSIDFIVVTMTLG